jgi:hypothetical protein
VVGSTIAVLELDSPELAMIVFAPPAKSVLNAPSPAEPIQIANAHVRQDTPKIAVTRHLIPFSAAFEVVAQSEAQSHAQDAVHDFCPLDAASVNVVELAVCADSAAVKRLQRRVLWTRSEDKLAMRCGGEARRQRRQRRQHVLAEPGAFGRVVAAASDDDGRRPVRRIFARRQ